MNYRTRTIVLMPTTVLLTTLSAITASPQQNNPQTTQWQQTWVSNTGNMLELHGMFQDGALHYQGESLTRTGSKIHHRLTFSQLPEGRVRQLWEQSRDDGKTWTVALDGEYVKKK